MDANFRLKNQLASNYSQDPGLGIGWAYMVPQRPYEEYVLSRVNDADVSTPKLIQSATEVRILLRLALALVSRLWRRRIIDFQRDCDIQGWVVHFVEDRK
jgi:hypothetical protein